MRREQDAIVYGRFLIYVRTADDVGGTVVLSYIVLQPERYDIKSMIKAWMHRDLDHTKASEHTKYNNHPKKINIIH